VTGDFEYDIHSTSLHDYELRVLDAAHTAPAEYLSDGDSSSDVEPTLTPTEATTATVPPAFQVTINLAYTPKALTHFAGVTDLKNKFVLGLQRINDTLKNSRINARVLLGRVAKVAYTENDTMKLVRDDVEAGLVSGLPVPTGKNKTVLVADVFGKWSGTAMLGGPYIVIKYGFISTNLLAHEVGHSFNCVHERAFQFGNGRYTTMIQDGSLGREPIYSNPNATWLGQAAGTTYHFNARRICEHFKLGLGCWLP
jgi:hypothetical protein